MSSDVVTRAKALTIGLDRAAGGFTALQAEYPALKSLNFPELLGGTADVLRELNANRDRLLADHERLRAEKQALEAADKRGVSFCSFCGWSEEYDNTDAGAQSHAAAMLAVHVRGCKKHPLVARAEAAEAEVVRLRAFVQHSNRIDCPLCCETIVQVASATLSLALWQHVNWKCSRQASLPPSVPQLQEKKEDTNTRVDAMGDSTDNPTASEYEVVPSPRCSECRTELPPERGRLSVCEACVKAACDRLSAIQPVEVPK